jgi:hypothetical protein
MHVRVVFMSSTNVGDFLCQTQATAVGSALVDNSLSNYKREQWVITIKEVQSCS